MIFAVWNYGVWDLDFGVFALEFGVRYLGLEFCSLGIWVWDSVLRFVVWCLQFGILVFGIFEFGVLDKGYGVRNFGL